MSEASGGKGRVEVTDDGVHEAKSQRNTHADIHRETGIPFWRPRGKEQPPCQRWDGGGDSGERAEDAYIEESAAGGDLGAEADERAEGANEGGSGDDQGQGRVHAMAAGQIVADLMRREDSEQGD